MQLGELAKNVGIVDFPGAGMMAARDVGDVDEIDEVQVFFELGNEVAGRNLLVKEIVEEFDVRIANGAYDLKAFGGVRQEVFGILFGVDVLYEKVDFVFCGDVRAALKGFDTVGMHLFWRKAGNLVAGLHDETRTFEFPHGRDEIAQGFEKGVAFSGIRERNPYAASAVNLDA